MNSFVIKIIAFGGFVAIAIIGLAYYQTRQPLTPAPTIMPTPTPTVSTKPSAPPPANPQPADTTISNQVDVLLDSSKEQSALLQDNESQLMDSDNQELSAFTKVYDETNL